MRIGLVIYGSLDTLSGGYLYDRRLVNTLRAQGDQVEVISMPWSHYAGHLAHNLDRGWVEQIVRLKLDLLLQDELNHPSLVGLNVALRKRVAYPMISIVHHLRGSEQHPGGLSWLYRKIERQYLRSVDGFVFNSQTTRRVVESRLNSQKQSVVATPGGNRFAGASLMEIRSRSAAGGPLRVLFVGNLIRRKGLGDLLKGLARMGSSDWRLRVVGQRDVDGVYSAEMKKLARDLGILPQVEFLGRLSEEQLEIELRLAHLLAVPSQYEGFGIVYLEGMAFGLPALGSKTGAAGEIIQDGESGWLVDPANTDDMAQRIGRVLQDRVELQRMSLAARCRFDEFPGWEESAAAIRTFLAGLV